MKTLVAALVFAAGSLSACVPLCSTTGGSIEAHAGLEAMAWGTVESVQEVALDEQLSASAAYYEHPLQPDIGDEIVVRLDHGEAVTVMQTGERRFAPGERVRVFVSEYGALLM